MSHTHPPLADDAVGTTVPVISIRPVVLPAHDRGEDLQVRVSAPATGDALPVVIFSHGFSESMVSYARLADYWADHGFVVIQPTHLDSQTIGLAPDDPRTPRVWRFRIEDLTCVLNELDHVEAAAPGLAGRLDRSRVAVAGHSWGATIASALIGARVIDADGRAEEDMSDPPVRAGVLLAVAGTGGDDLTPFAAERFAFMNPDFSQMEAPALLVAGDHDQSLLSTRGPDWWTDAYTLSPSGKSLLTLFEAEHTLGGIAEPSAHATSDWSLERVALIQRVSTAFLRSALEIDDQDWSEARAALQEGSHTLGRLDSR